MTSSVPRIIGAYGDARTGPLVVGIGGVHGNEPSGVRALDRVVERLERSRPPFRGRLLAVAGNLAALGEGRRFIERDLNRGWSAHRVTEALASPTTVEDAEQAAVLGILVPAIRACEGKAVVLDLHTTSSASAPFVTLRDEPAARAFAARLGIPLVLGIETEIDTMVDYLTGFGAVAIGIESGQHADPASIDLHEAALWLSLVAAGCLAETTEVVEVADCRARLSRAREGLPDVFEVVYRRGIEAQDAFRMSGEFRNFTPVEAGQVVAEDARGPVETPLAARLFLPLYQPQGDDGYFLVRPIEANGARETDAPS